MSQNEDLVQVEFITGNAGTGKTCLLKQRIQDSRYAKQTGKATRNYGTLCATTGIAAVNLTSKGESGSVGTINSELKYFDTESLLDNAASGKLQKALQGVSVKGRNLVIDEISMMEDRQLDCIYDNLVEVNKLENVQSRGGLGLVLSGDFCQLQPVKGKPAYYARCWPRFAEKLNRLTKVWRQDNPDFLTAINFAREGDGDKAAESLKAIKGVKWREDVDSKFDGTTIMSTNKEVDNVNRVRLLRLFSSGKKAITIKSFRWGNQLPEWKLIPYDLELAESAYVMILSNDSPEFSYANGDCAYVTEANETNRMVYVKLVRNDVETCIPHIIRRVMVRDLPYGMPEPVYLKKKEWKEKNHEAYADYKSILLNAAYRQYLVGLTIDNKKSKWGDVYFDYVEGKWVVGEIDYIPLRLAYASTCHKSQGLSLDRVQIDYSHHFFGSPSMSYVALSRCRTPGGLTIVGSPKLLASRTNILEETLQWI